MNKELKRIVEQERILYIPHIKSFKNRFMAWYTHAEEYMIFCYMRNLRMAEYYKNNNNKILYSIWIRKANIIGEKLRLSIPAGVLGENVKIFHGGIVINILSEVGEGCLFHGDNCIGNNGKDNLCPVLGKRVEIGIGAKIIGNITLADDIKVGANAVVTRSFLEPGITLVGVPARKA